LEKKKIKRLQNSFSSNKEHADEKRAFCFVQIKHSKSYLLSISDNSNFVNYLFIYFGFLSIKKK